MKILITGAGGMLGTDLAARLASEHELTGAGRKPAPHLNIPFYTGDLAKFQTTRDLVQSALPEVILHAAAMTDVDGCETRRLEALRNNFDATRNVVNAGNRANALIIFFSTDFVFDGTKPGPYEESDIPHPLSVYGETKLLAERYLLLKGRRFLILRTSWLFGRAGNNFPKKVLKQAEAGTPFSVISDQIGNPTYTADLAEAVSRILAFLSHQQTTGTWNQIYHAANEGAVSRYEFACAVLKKKNYSTDLVKPIASESAPPRPAARPRNSSLATEKIKGCFGIRLRPWEEALDSYLREDVGLRV